MPHYVYSLICAWCGTPGCEVDFGRRSDDTNVVLWTHECEEPTQQRAGEYITTSLPTDIDGNLIPPEGQ